MPCETLFAHLQEGRGLITARIVYRHRERSEPLGLSDEVLGVLSARGVANDISHSRARILQFSGGGLELLRIPSGNRHRMCALCEAARDRCPQAARCAHAHNEYARPRRLSQLRIHDHLQTDAPPKLPAITCLRRRGAFLVQAGKTTCSIRASRIGKLMTAAAAARAISAYHI